MQIVLDTTKTKEYKGRVGTAFSMLKKDECDTFIVSGAHFICYRYEDRELGKKVREFTLQSLKESSVRYIIVCTMKNGERYCLSSDFTLNSSFNRAYYYNNIEFATAMLPSARKKLGLSIADTLEVEEYLYHRKPKCTLRIYHTIRGLATDYGLLSFIKEQIAKGILFERLDKRGKPYILLDDLLIFKGQSLKLVSATGVAYTRELSLELLLHDGLIAFESVYKFAQSHPELEIPELAYAAPREGATKRKFYDLGAVFYTNSAVQEVTCREMAIANAWF